MGEKKNRGGAPKGNKNAVGNGGGRPPLYSEADQLQIKVDEYFKNIEGDYHLEGDEGKEFKVWDRNPEPATITGLAYFLGFESRSTIYEYQKKVEFSSIIKRAMLKVEHGYELQLYNSKPTGAIFALKNMDWHDKQELTGADGNDLFPPARILTKEEAKEYLQSLDKNV